MSFAFGFGLPHWLPLSGGFTPASLFGPGIQGTWYDPSDYGSGGTGGVGTLFTDSAGTTPVTGVEQVVGLMLDKSGNANNATSTGAARPTLRARYNLLTYSEEFDNGAWAKFQSSVAANTSGTTDPLGGNTADKLIPNNGSTIPFIYNSAVASVVGAQYAASVYVKAAELGFAFVVNNTRSSSTQAGVCVNLSTGATSNGGANGTYAVTDAGNGWWRVTATTTATNTNGYLEVWPMAAAGTGGYAGNGTSGIFLWGAQLLTAADVTATGNAYQRIAAATVYDTSNSVWRPYLAFGGTQAMSTGSIDFTATDKMTVWAGVTQQSTSTNTGQITELSADVGNNNGGFGLAWPSATDVNTLRFQARGTTFVGVNDATAVSPGTAVIAMQVDISAPSIIGRRNNLQVATSSSSLGTGNFGNYPLYIGARNNGASLPFTGRIYSLITRGAQSTAAEISATESWVNQKTGAY